MKKILIKQITSPDGKATATAESVVIAPEGAIVHQSVIVEVSSSHSSASAVSISRSGDRTLDAS